MWLYDTGWDDEAIEALTASRVCKCCQRCDLNHKINQTARIRRNEIGYIRAHIPVFLLCPTRQSWLMDAHKKLNYSRGIRQPLAMLRRWQWLNEHETRVITKTKIQRFLLVTRLVSTVNLTMLTRTWLLRLPSLAQIFLNCRISAERWASKDPVNSRQDELT